MIAQEKLVYEKSLTELDLQWPYCDNDDPEERNEINTPWKEMTWAEVPGINLNDLTQILSEAAAAGANRMYIGTSTDHHGYYFYGVKLTHC